MTRPRLLGCGCLASYRSCDFCDISSFLVKDSSWQADTFSFRSHLPLKSGLLKGKGGKNVHLSNVRAFTSAGAGGRWQIHSPGKTSSRRLVWLWSLSMGKYIHGLEYLPN